MLRSSLRVICWGRIIQISMNLLKLILNIWISCWHNNNSCLRWINSNVKWTKQRKDIRLKWVKLRNVIGRIGRIIGHIGRGLLIVMVRVIVWSVILLMIIIRRNSNVIVWSDVGRGLLIVIVRDIVWSVMIMIRRNSNGLLIRNHVINVIDWRDWRLAWLSLRVSY